MANNLKITADTSQVKKSILELNKTMKSLGQTKVSFISEAERKFFSDTFKTHIEKINKELKQKNSEIKKATEEQKKLIKGSKEEVKKQNELVKLMRERMKIQRSLSTIQGGQAMMGGASGGGGLLSKLGGGMFSKLPGMGMLARLGPMGLLGGAVAGAGGFALSRGMQGMQTFESGIQDRIALRGRGFRDMRLADPTRASGLGISGLEMRRRRLESESAFGRAGAGQEDVLGRASFERNFGLQGGSLTNVGATLRQTMGGTRANEAVAKLQATILASGIEDALGPYLETATTLLGSINEQGALNSTEILGVLSELSKNGLDVPEQIAKSFQSMQGAITGSTGEANAFFQSAFARAGIGGGMMGTAGAAINSGGLFGIDTGNLAGLGTGAKRGNILQNLQSLGITGQGTGFQTRSKAILDELKIMSGVDPSKSMKDIGPEQQHVMTAVAQNMGLGKDYMQSLQAISRLEDAMKGRIGEKEFKDQMKMAQMSPELKNLEDIKRSNVGQLDALNNLNETLKDRIGEKLAPINKAMKSSLNSIDGTLLGIADYLNPTEETKNKKRAKEYTDTVNRINELEGIPGMLSPEHQSELRGLKRSKDRMQEKAFEKGTDFRPYLDKEMNNEFNDSVHKKYDKKGSESLKEKDEKIRSVEKAPWSDITKFLKNISENSSKPTKVDLKGGMSHISNRVVD